MHILLPKHSKLKPQEANELLKKFNISVAQLPKISIIDSALPEGCNIGDIVKIERKEENEQKGEININLYFRVVV